MIGMIFVVLVAMSLFFAPTMAAERYSDPDGCFSCHGLKGLQYVDAQGLLRDASIDPSHYYSSLHGSVPCTDCHRKIRYYPHKPENGWVDCAESCHVNEPSNGEAFSHKQVVEEFNQSVHHAGASKDFSGANRLTEARNDLSPSCRKCHSNTAYIEADQLDKFMASFQHTETECGTCHQGETWRNQLSGHILRRFIGARWKKRESNASCQQCHNDKTLMQQVLLTDPSSQQKYNASPRWQQAGESYTKSLHSRILAVGDEKGASCLDCHAPKDQGLRHHILSATHQEAATHQEHLPETCGASGCHQFAKSDLNAHFVNSDQHSLDYLPFQLPHRIENWTESDSPWYQTALVLLTIATIFWAGNLSYSILRFFKTEQEPIFGTERFKRLVLARPSNRKARPSNRKTRPSNRKARPSNGTTRPSNRTAGSNKKSRPDNNNAGLANRKPRPTHGKTRTNNQKAIPANKDAAYKEKQ